MAGRIPKSFIDDVLARTDVVDVVDARVPLKKAGSNHVACCPFHSEKTPSFTVSQNKQFYHCFGCGAHGTAIGFLMEYERLSFPEAVESLAHDLGLEVPREGGGPPARDHSPLYAVLQKANEFFQQQLRHSETAKSYLKKRGLSGPTAKAYEVGFAPPGWENLVAKIGDHDRLLEAGLANRRESGGLYDRFRNRVVFPIHDRRGRVVGFGGRVIDPKEEPKYLNSPETPVFHKGRELYGLYRARMRHRRLERLLVVEGYMDVVMLAEHGIDFAVATLGTATTADHLRTLFRATPEIVFCFDGDSAGQQAAWRAFETTLAELDDRHQVRFLFLPEGEDPDSLVQREGPERFIERIEQAQTLSAYFLGELGQRFDTASLDGRAQLADFARPLIKNIQADVLRELIAGEVADLVGVGRGRLLGQTEAPAPTPPRRRRASGRRLPQLEMNDIRVVIAALLSKPALVAQAGDVRHLASLRRPGIPLLMELVEMIQAEPELTTARILERYRDRSEYNALNKLAAYEFLNPDDDPELLDQIFHDAVAQLTRKMREQRYDDLLNKLREAPDRLTDAEREEIQAFGRS